MTTPIYYIGQVLPNGALVIATRIVDDSSWVILAIKEGGNASHLFEPYVTWAANDDGETTYWGHYFQDFNEAAKDFANR